MKKNRPWLVNAAAIALLLLLTLGAWLLSEALPRKKITPNAGQLGGFEPAATAPAEDPPSPLTDAQGGNDPI